MTCQQVPTNRNSVSPDVKKAYDHNKDFPFHLLTPTLWRQFLNPLTWKTFTNYIWTDTISDHQMYTKRWGFPLMGWKSISEAISWPGADFTIASSRSPSQSPMSSWRLQEIRNLIPRPRRGLVDRKKTLQRYCEASFRDCYRLSKETVLELCGRLEPDLTRHTNHSQSLPVHLQVLTALCFFAVGIVRFNFISIKMKLPLMSQAFCTFYKVAMNNVQTTRWHRLHQTKTHCLLLSFSWRYCAGGGFTSMRLRLTVTNRATSTICFSSCISAPTWVKNLQQFWECRWINLIGWCMIIRLRWTLTETWDIPSTFSRRFRNYFLNHIMRLRYKSRKLWVLFNWR